MFVCGIAWTVAITMSQYDGFYAWLHGVPASAIASIAYWFARAREMRTIENMTSVALMLTLAPFCAVTTLALCDPERWGEQLASLSLMTGFGIMVTPRWIAYIPAIVVTPMLMTAISKQRWFIAAPLWVLIVTAIPLGGIVGILVLTPLWARVVSESAGLTTNWMLAGAISGSITLAAIVALYRLLVAKRIDNSLNNGVALTGDPLHGPPAADP